MNPPPDRVAHWSRARRFPAARHAVRRGSDPRISADAIRARRALRPSRVTGDEGLRGSSAAPSAGLLEQCR
jgi:hypothetical protein